MTSTIAGDSSALQEFSIDEIVSTIECDTHLIEHAMSLKNEMEEEKISVENRFTVGAPGKESLYSYLREQIYNAALSLCECSYAEAYEYSVGHAPEWKEGGSEELVQKFKARAADNKRVQISHLVVAGYADPTSDHDDPKTDHDTGLASPDDKSKLPYRIIEGKTGLDNSVTDKTCIVSENKNINIIIVAFHGSAGKNFGSYTRNDNDWGSILSYTPRNAGDLLENRCHVPEKKEKYSKHLPEVYFHGGFLENYRSVHEELYTLLRNKLATKMGAYLPSSWIIFTGHSKGAGMATIAGSILTKLLHEEFPDANFGILAFSSPRVVSGEESRDWVQTTMGHVSTINNIAASENIIRVNVNSDMVTMLPLKCQHQYHHVGINAQEDIRDVLRRIKAKHIDGAQSEIEISSVARDLENKLLLIPQEFLNQFVVVPHYGNPINGNDVVMFDSDLVMNYHDFMSHLVTQKTKLLDMKDYDE